ncbi:adenylate cyclase [Halalkalibacter wakoensis JCM 9140]|uniref:Adenylate cyclase n=1 Tax=Halalkalibacter wakoensis JCM 9140 TaxID=1236970 RepID=W4Q1R2_9BACI|nr:CYTH domain-containing protein [Halalkalibacter wakoensis]GAE25314.1 adenylate cyclase [Halalkalibacter wakoensis JCM 9140]
MSQEIEIEVKSKLTEDGFYLLLKTFSLDHSDSLTQHNHYFETPAFDLKHAHSGLRIREIDDDFTLTLKQPHEIGKLETHQSLTKDEWDSAKQTGTLPDGNVKKQLRSLHIPINELSYVGTLTTERIEIAHNSGVLCFDKSMYFDQVDYEIEFEGTSEEHAHSTLASILSKASIPYTETENKVRRFFTRKIALEQPKRP